MYARFALKPCVLSLAVLFGVSDGVFAKDAKVNFKLIYHAAQLSNQAYDGKSKILGKHKGRSAWVATPGDTNVQYILLQNHARKVQGIAIRGTVDDTNWDLDTDTYGVKDKKAGVLLHRGFKKAAENIYRSVKPRLKPGYATYLTGHSLGGAVAGILGIYLSDDGFKLGGIYTFGQPKFTNKAGAVKYKKIPLLRVIYQNDTVAMLPNSITKGDGPFVHMGAVINLLVGPYYVYGNKEQGMRFSEGSFGKMFSQLSVPDHKMKWYLKNLKEKQKGVKEVGFPDRNKHIFRHRPGKYAEPMKRKSNFNHHR